VAIDFKTENHFNGGVSITFNPNPEATALRFGFSYNADGGLHYTDGDAENVVLPRSDIKQLSPYRFALEIDFSAGTYDIAITGEHDDGSPLFHEKKGIPFQGTFSPSSPGDAIYLFNTTPTVMTGYFQSIVVERLE